MVLYIGGGRGGDVGQELVDVLLFFGVGSAVFAYPGGDTVGGGGVDVLFSEIRSTVVAYNPRGETVGGWVEFPLFENRGTVFDYSGGDSMGVEVGEPEQS